MKVNTSDINICGTHLQGYVNISYSSLVKKLGPPESSGCEKSQAEWKISDGDVVATIYDWKEYCNPKKISHWHIGGNSPKAVTLISEILNVRCEMA